MILIRILHLTNCMTVANDIKLSIVQPLLSSLVSVNFMFSSGDDAILRMNRPAAEIIPVTSVLTNAFSSDSFDMSIK